jgi:uncharacterized protein
MDVRKQRALVTGASGGIGAALAAGLARRGADLALVARSADGLEAVAEDLRDRYGVDVVTIPTDLAVPDGVDRVIDAMGDRGVDIVVPNAGVGSHGPFASESDGRLRAQVDLNCTAVARMVHAYLPGMIERRRGAVLTVASTAAFQPTPEMAVYGATKAFVLSFTEALWYELRDSGVHVLALCPGPTSTGFFAVAGTEDIMTRGRQTPDVVAEVGLRALERGKGPTVVSGLANTVTASAHRFVPRGLMARMSAAYTSR